MLRNTKLSSIFLSQWLKCWPYIDNIISVFPRMDFQWVLGLFNCLFPFLLNFCSHKRFYWAFLLSFGRLISWLHKPLPNCIHFAIFRCSVGIVFMRCINGFSRFHFSCSYRILVRYEKFLEKPPMKIKELKCGFTSFSPRGNDSQFVVLWSPRLFLSIKKLLDFANIKGDSISAGVFFA